MALQPVGRPQLEGKVTPEMAMFILLDEIAGRLAAVEGILKNQQAEGHFYNITLSVTAVPQEVRFKAFGYTLFNDGANEVYTSEQQNVDTGSRAGAIQAKASDQVSFGAIVDTRFWIACASGETASVIIRVLV